MRFLVFVEFDDFLYCAPASDGNPEFLCTLACPDSPVGSPLTLGDDTRALEAANAVAISTPVFTVEDKEYPRVSLVTHQHQSLAGLASFPLPTVHHTHTKSAWDKWVEDNLSSHILVKLNDKNGKDSLHQCFKSQAVLWHCLLPMI